MTTQVDKVKKDFAKRLQLAMDTKNYPLRGRSRILSKEFGISDKATCKWLNGEAIPETSKIPILANFLDISSEWLLSGKNHKEVENKDIESLSGEFNPLYKNFLRDLNKAFNENKLSPEIISVLNQSLILMIKP